MSKQIINWQGHLFTALVILLVVVALLLLLLIRGADVRQRNADCQREMDEEQMRILAEMRDKHQKGSKEEK